MLVIEIKDRFFYISLIDVAFIHSSLKHTLNSTKGQLTWPPGCKILKAMTKLRVGLVSESKDLLEPVKADLPGSYVYYSKTLFELSQIYGNLKLDAVIFTEGTLPGEADLQSSLNFLRLIANFKESLVFFIHHRTDFKLKGLFFDPLLRSYAVFGGTLIPMLQLQSLANGMDPHKFAEPLDPEWLQAELARPLSALIGLGSAMPCSDATDDEAHSSFICQSSNEIASNLVWMKLTARILENESERFKERYSSLADQEMEHKAEQLLIQVLSEFKENVVLRLKDEGAVFLQGFESLTPSEKIELVRRGRPRTLIFKSNMCHVLIEQIRYT